MASVLLSVLLVLHRLFTAPHNLGGDMIGCSVLTTMLSLLSVHVLVATS